MTRDELIAAVEKLSNVDGSEEELTALMLQLEEALPNARIRNVMYHSGIERTSIEIVDEALRLVAIPKLQLAPPPLKTVRLEEHRDGRPLRRVTVESLSGRVWAHLRDAPERSDRVRAVWRGFLAALQEKAVLPEATRRRALAILERPLPPAADALDEPDLPDTFPDEIAEAASLADAMEPLAELYPGHGMWKRIGDGIEKGLNVADRLYWAGFLVGLHEHGMMETTTYWSMIDGLDLDSTRELVELCVDDVAFVATFPEFQTSPISNDHSEAGAIAVQGLTNGQDDQQLASSHQGTGSMTREEMIAAVEKISNVDGPDEELIPLLLKLEDALPNGDVRKLMYFSKVKRTSVEIVDEALRLVAIPKLQLAPPRSGT